MNWWLPHNFEKKGPILKKRAQLLGRIRNFFDSKNFFEVETPALQICPVMDAHIHAFKTDLLGIDRSIEQTMYLHTSPEFDMKKLLSAGMERIYQICHVYRNAESSALHSPEFTLLEWYRTGADYQTLMDDCVELCRSLGVETFKYKNHVSDPFKEWERISVCEAFEKYTEIELPNYLDDRDGFVNTAKDNDIRVVDTDHWDDIFHAIMAARIEPNLGQGVPTILYDYPISLAALSKRKDADRRFAERFELYICGVEIANAFSELTDAEEQRARYLDEMALKKKLYGEIYPPDEEFFKALEYIPKSAGIALGVDRLIMLATGADDINDVLWAPVQRL